MQKINNDVYVLDTNGHASFISGDRMVLVDTGTKPENLIAELEKANYTLKDIEHVIITHVHYDHVGGLAKIMEMSDATVAAHEIEAKYIQKDEIYNGPPGPMDMHPSTKVDHLLKDGQIYEGLVVIHTPGHTEGHIALLDREQGILYAGDALRNDEGVGIGPMPDKFTIDPVQHRKSIEKILTFDFNKVIVGHGHPVEEHGHDAVSKIKSHPDY